MNDLAILQVRVPGATWAILVSARRGVEGVGLVRPDAVYRAKALLKLEAEGTRVRVAPAGLLGLAADGAWLLRGTTTTRVGRSAGEEEPLGEATRPRPAEAAFADLTELETWAQRGELLLTRLEGSRLESARQALLVRLDREANRLVKRVKAIGGDLARGDEAARAAERATPFVAAAARAPRGTASLAATDWTTGEPEERHLDLDPAKRPRDQVEAIFARARRLKRGAAVAIARLDDANAKQARLARLRSAALEAPTLEALAAASVAMHREDPALLPGLSSRKVAPTDAPSKRPSSKPSERAAYRTFLSTSGSELLVGKGAADNDELTLHVARPHDLWLHAKGTPGAHVVIRLTRGASASAEMLVDGALLAAHFSDARGEPIVDVTYVERRHVRKRRGAAPGEVQVDRDKTLILRVDEARLARLLQREEQS